MKKEKFYRLKGIFCLVTAAFVLGAIFFLLKIDDSYSYERYVASLPEGEEPGLNGGALIFIIYAIMCTAFLLLGAAWIIRAGIAFFKKKESSAFWFEFFGKGATLFALITMLACAKMSLAIGVYSIFIAYMVASLITSIVYKTKLKNKKGGL